MAANEKLMKGAVTGFAKEMRKLVNCKEMSDIKFVIGPERKHVFAHRCILSTRCEVFKAMFSDQGPNDSNDVPFVLSEVDPDIFLAVMEFVYTNCVTLNGKIAIDVLASGIEYGLDELRRLCVQYLIESLSVSSAGDSMQAGVTYGQDDLSAKSLEFIENNTKSVFKTKGFNEMSDTALAVVLQSNKLSLDEVEILQHIKDWAAVNSVVMHKKVHETSALVIQHIRFPLFSPDELKQVEKDNVKDKIVPISVIAYAWKFHALKQAEPGNLWTRMRKGTTKRECHSGLIPWDS